ncbi:phosphate acetyltransferase [Rhodoblastus acidophilus]|uniref:phosphate acetyltransferase n=1 Tax=Rhodoblastus acidophilus TaxID=1074 RepID=UPI002224C856|nr:phosphate acetyltransferase [Rhodoblastus acidophilus]MCW2286457.1 phosphate acetyltransferase [Rhodoblastus acidophilus]MCW2335306.1 phosphate acetyltransferase [Rhodoblastus acidophilus]
MNAASRHRAFYLVPLSRQAGLTSMALGLARALRLAGLRVGFSKPIAQPEPGAEQDLSAHFARALCGAKTPDAIAFERAATLLRAGELSVLMEDVVAQVETQRADCDVMIVEGLIPDADIQIATRLNIEIIRTLGADIIPALSGHDMRREDIVAKVATAVEQYGDDGKRAIAGVLVNHCDDALAAALVIGGPLRFAADAAPAPILAAAPFDAELAAPRVIDVADSLGLEIVHRGEIETRRAQTLLVAARPAEKLLSHLTPGALVVTPADRSDALLASALAAQRGMPLAGFVLTCGTRPAPEIRAILDAPPLDRLPILATSEDTYSTASRLSNLSRHIGRDDTERMERVVSFIAERIDTRALAQRIGAPSDDLMPPPVFRHRVVEAARAAALRIVLPEGDEPRTLKAAAICAEKGVARCVLLGAPEKIRAVAAAHGVDLPANVEILDPEAIRPRFVAPMVELRKSKGLTALQAEMSLEDTVVLGTMMLAQGDVDGLVSGAVHTTANTVRPALQLIKTAPGSKIVSSVFFMLMPDQVFVYGDCAINPDPSAQELAEIAIQSADSAAAFGIEPRVAMISYSTGASGTGEDVEKVRRATELVRERRPDLVIDGPIQYDAASVESVGRQKAPDSPLGGHANVFIFPDLNTGNTTYKAVQRSANVVSVGPMLQGLRKPVNDLSRGALVDDIVYTIALTAIQAQAGKRETRLAAAAE